MLTFDADTCELKAEGFEATDLPQVLDQIRAQEKTLRRLTLKPGYYTPLLDLVKTDWALAFPMLTHLHLKQSEVNLSVFRHPTLVQLRLDSCVVEKAAKVEVGMSPHASSLQMVELLDTGILPSTLHFGAACALESFRSFIGDDAVDEPTETYVFDGLPHLRTIEIRAGNGWDLVLKGCLPALENVELDGGTYGGFEVQNGATSGSSDYALALNTKNAQAEFE